MAKEWEQVREKEKEDAAPSADPENRPRTKHVFADFAKGAFATWFGRLSLALSSGD